MVLLSCSGTSGGIYAKLANGLGSEQLRSGLLTHNSTPAIAFIEGLQRGVSIGPRKRRIAINPRIVDYMEGG